MIKNVIQFVKIGRNIVWRSGTLVGKSTHSNVVQLITDESITDIAQVTVSIKDSVDLDKYQYLIPTSYKGGDVLATSNPYYQDVALYNVFEVELKKELVSVVSKFRTGRVAFSFSFVSIEPSANCITYKGKFGLNTPLPTTGQVLGDYYECEDYNYVLSRVTYSKGMFVVWNGTSFVADWFYFETTTEPIDVPIQPAVSGTYELTTDERNYLASIGADVALHNIAISAIQQDIIDMKDGTDAFSEILLGTAQIRYNSTKKIVEQVFDDGTTLEVGLELWAIARNEDSTILKNGEVAAINGVVGQQLSVVHADPSDDNLHFKELGVCTMDANIAVNGTGKITHFGEVNGIPIANFEVTGVPYAENQELYVSVNGKLTNVQPAKPITHIHAGWILRTIGSDANIFVYFVKVPHFDHLSDVIITTPTNGDIPILGSDGIWRNSQRLVTAESEITKIKDGTTIVKKSEQDKNGNDIVNTYETKSDATSKKSEIDARLNTAEGEIDALQGEVQDLENANMIKSYTYNPSTHVLTFTYYDNSTTSFDLPLESAIVGASYDNVTKDITFTLQSGATLVVPLDDLISGLASETWVTTYFIPKTALKTAFSATPLDTNVISEKLAIQGLQNYTKPFIMPALQFPNYDTVTKTLDFKSDATFKTMLYYGKEKYDIPVGTVVVDNNATSAVQLIFNVTSKTFSFIPHTQTLGDNEIRVAVYKRLANFYEWDFPCDLTVDGVSVKKEYARFATISFTTNLPNYDIDSKTLTFLSTGLPMKLIYGFENYDLPSSLTLTLPTASSIHNLLFDTKTKTLYFQIWSTQIRPVDVYLGTIRTLTGVVDCNFTFPVTINNQFVYSRKNLDGENQLWYRSAIYNAIDNNQNKKFANNISFTFLTDTHIMSTNKHRLQHYGNHNKFVKSKSIDFSIYGGDIVEGNDVSKETTKRYISEVVELTATERETFVLFGNHDDNSYYTTSPLLSNMVNKKELYDRILEPLNNDVVHDSINLTSGYYYKDYPNKKVRIICLDYIDYPVMDNGDGTAKWSGRNYWGYGARQVTWLETEASNIPNGYKVIVFSHGPARASLNAFGAEVKNGNLVEGILQALSTGGTFTGSTTGTDYDVTVNCDFTTQGARKVLAFVHGHTHADYINKPSGLDFVYISVANSSDSVVDVGAIPTGATRPTTRELGTTTEDLWDVFNINIDSGDISITRFGAGSDRTYDV